MDDFLNVGNLEATVTEATKYSDVPSKLNTYLYYDQITPETCKEVAEYAQGRCAPESELPDDATRVANLEVRCAEYDRLFKQLGVVDDPEWPLVAGDKFESADAFRRTGDKVAMKLDGENAVRRYVCKLNPAWEEKGTNYTPLGNAASWWECTGKTEDEIAAYVAEWKSKFPGFTAWGRQSSLPPGIGDQQGERRAVRVECSRRRNWRPPPFPQIAYLKSITALLSC